MCIRVIVMCEEMKTIILIIKKYVNASPHSAVYDHISQHGKRRMTRRENRSMYTTDSSKRKIVHPIHYFFTCIESYLLFLLHRSSSSYECCSSFSMTHYISPVALYIQQMLVEGLVW